MIKMKSTFNFMLHEECFTGHQTFEYVVMLESAFFFFTKPNDSPELVQQVDLKPLVNAFCKQFK